MSSDNTQKLPNLVGLDVNSVTKTLDSMGIYYTGNYQFNDSVPKGQVISQDPAAGTYAPKGSRVTFVISDGKQPEQQTITYEVNESPQQGTQEQQTENTPAAQPDMSGAQKYLGTWYSFRPYANITQQDNGKYLVAIRWTSSATEGVLWSFQADYDPYNDILIYSDGLEIPCYFNTKNREWVNIAPCRYDLSGYLQWISDSELLWFDDGVDGSSGVVFYKS